MKTRSTRKAVESALEAIGENVMPVMQGVSSFVDSIIKVASGQYIKGYDDKGKPIYGKITKTQLIDASNWIVEAMTTFISKFAAMKKANKKAVDDMDDFVEDINPIFGVISKFVNSIKPFLELKEGSNEALIFAIDKTTKRRKIDILSENIASGFESFVKKVSEGLANSFSDANVKKAQLFSQNATQYITELSKICTLYSKLGNQSEGLEKARKSVDVLMEAIKQMVDMNPTSKMVDQIGPLTKYTNSLNEFTEAANNAAPKIGTLNTKLERSFDLMKKFDTELIDKDAKRIEALNHLAECFDKVAQNMERVSNSIDNMKTDQVLENFKGVRDLLNIAADTFKPIKQTVNEKVDNIQQRIRTNVQNFKERVSGGSSSQPQQVVQVPQNPLASGTNVTFVFSNVKFNGTIL